MAKTLIIDDEPSILSVLSTLLRGHGHEIHPVLGGEKALDVLANEDFDLMISDIRMVPVDGMEVLRKARKTRPGMSVIMITAYASVETAVEAMKEGAFDYITKPFKVDEILITVQRALEYQHAIKENVSLREQLQTRYSFDNLIAESPQMRRVCQMVQRVAPTDQTILISGESGVGKEVIAKAIHSNSTRKANSFVAINCAALPEPLLESELFGHKKGAFTGASVEKKGLFEEANEGSIFLDEIGSTPKSIQGKLLRVLQEREVRKVGGNRTINVDVRVIAASNGNLEQMISDGTFREDLFYRLSVIPIHLEPLRERREDILPLVYHFLNDMYKGKENLLEIDRNAQYAIEHYNWPGNVRELENAVRHAVTFANDGVITVDELPLKIAQFSPPQSSYLSNLSETVDRYLGKSLKAFLRHKEKEYISTVIDHCGGNKEKAAKTLKVSLATLYRKLPESLE